MSELSPQWVEAGIGIGTVIAMLAVSEARGKQHEKELLTLRKRSHRHATFLSHHHALLKDLYREWFKREMPEPLETEEPE